MTSHDKPVVLVADDEDPSRTAMADTLRFFNYDVLEASSGQELFDKVDSLLNDQKKLDVLIVDNQMPNHPGEADSRWCGFERMKELCIKWNGDLGRRVLFVSRWGLIDLPDEYQKKSDVNTSVLLQAERWFSTGIPFFILISRIEDMLSQKGVDHVT
jgi:hypothetical protein